MHGDARGTKVLGCWQEAEALRRAEGAAQAKQALLDQLQEQLTRETAAGTALRSQAAALEAQLHDARAKCHALQSLVQVRLCATDASSMPS
jgi:chromosome segregation ATPase